MAANLSAWAEGLGQVALARGVDVASGHAMLARLHKAAADPVAEGYRNPHRLRACPPPPGGGPQIKGKESQARRLRAVAKGQALERGVGIPASAAGPQQVQASVNRR